MEETKIKREKIRKVFLDELPRYDEGRCKGKINWEECKQYSVFFTHEDINGYINIIEYIKKKQILIVLYKNEEYKIATNSFINCKLGNILGKKTSNFKVQIGQTFQDDKRDITITDRKKTKDDSGIVRKYYKYKCNKCRFDCGEHYKDGGLKDELWLEESHLTNNIGCSCCSGKIVVKGINDIPTTAPWLIQYFQGGYDEAKKYTTNTHDFIYPICPHCGRIQSVGKRIDKICNTHSIGCACGDGFSYGHKYVFSLLTQLEQLFIDNYTFDWCKFYNIYKQKDTTGEYDFVLENKKLIIEVDGDFHRKDNKMNGQTKEESEWLDNEKDILANKYGYKVIRISDEGDIKDNIMNELNNIFDLSDINWLKCEEFALSNRAKEVCKYKKDNHDVTASDISKIKGIDRSTVTKWLKTGNEIGWCHYCTEEENRKAIVNNAIRLKEKSSKQVEIFKDDISLGVLPSATELERQSENRFGIKLIQSMISDVCLGKRKQYKGFTFKYV